VIDIPNIQHLERALDVTWGELTGLEPRLNELLWQVRAAGAGCRDREDVERVFARFRNALADLVGFRGSHQCHPVLGSVGAYQAWTAAGFPAVTPPDAGKKASDTER
jgi:hypothetical protein